MTHLTNFTDSTSSTINVYIVAAKRTPIVKAGLDLKDLPLPYLGTALLRNILDNYPALQQKGVPLSFELILGNVYSPPRYNNIARAVASMAGLPANTADTIAYTINQHSASGMQALIQAATKIKATGKTSSRFIFAGGIESMSQYPLLLSRELTNILNNLHKLNQERGKVGIRIRERLAALLKIRLKDFIPVSAMEQYCNYPIGMVSSAESLNREFDISREEQDLYAHNSHLRAIQAQKEGRFYDELVPLVVGTRIDRILTHDIGPKADSSLTRLANLPVIFDKKSGSVTAGNSFDISDGAAILLLAAEDVLQEYSLKPLAKIITFSSRTSSEPNSSEPNSSETKSCIVDVLQKSKLRIEDIDLFEIEDAFSSQILALQKVIAQELAPIPQEKINVNGGAISLGYPLGANAARMVVTLVHELRRRKGKYGLAALGGAGKGESAAIIIENQD
ncbi:MAG: thiolase family protein [Oligoflexia bacterium]|nr:thiolase family protein [Oligoflexia bacterium]